MEGSNSKWTNPIAWIIVFSVFLGFALGRAGIDIDLSYVPLLFIIIFFAILIIFISGELGYIKMLKNGKYAEGIEVLNKKLNKAWTKDVKNIYYFNIANAYNRMGDFEKSIENLNMIDEKKLDKNLKPNYYGLYASGLYWIEGDRNRILVYMEKSLEGNVLPNLDIVRSNIELLKGNKEGAERYINLYFKKKSEKSFVMGFKSMLIIDSYFEEIMSNLYIGMFYLDKGNEELAKKYLSLSADSKYENFYSSKAKELLRENKGECGSL
jgi:tetratricopeptide (TPR) repeat protein